MMVKREVLESSHNAFWWQSSRVYPSFEQPNLSEQYDVWFGGGDDIIVSFRVGQAVSVCAGLEVGSTLTELRPGLIKYESYLLGKCTYVSLPTQNYRCNCTRGHNNLCLRMEVFFSNEITDS